MNWDAAGALAEILGALAVIVTLVYLATQVRQASTSQRNATAWAITQALADMNSRLTSSADFTELWLRGGEDLGSLDSVESERYRAFAMDLLNLAIYVHTHRSDEHSFYFDHLANLARDYPGFRDKVESVRSSLGSDLYEKITGRPD